MATRSQSKSETIHGRLTHPVIDSDGHWIEFRPVFLDYLREVGGSALAERFQTMSSSFACAHGFDVPDMREVLEESWELVEGEAITEEDFRDFVFANPVRVCAGMNPNFFARTAIERRAQALLAGQRS
jgi:hypothetical protein